MPTSIGAPCPFADSNPPTSFPLLPAPSALCRAGVASEGDATLLGVSWVDDTPRGLNLSGQENALPHTNVSNRETNYEPEAIEKTTSTSQTTFPAATITSTATTAFVPTSALSPRVMRDDRHDKRGSGEEEERDGVSARSRTAAVTTNARAMEDLELTR